MLLLDAYLGITGKATDEDSQGVGIGLVLCQDAEPESAHASDRRKTKSDRDP